MKKRRVLIFFALMLCFAGIIFIVQVWRTGSLTGFALKDSILKYEVSNNDLSASIENIKREGNTLRIFYIVYYGQEQRGAAVVKALLTPEDDRWLVQAEQEIVLPIGKEGKYIIEMELPKIAYDELELILIVEKGEDRAIAQRAIDISSTSLTGFAIAGESKRFLQDIGIILLVLAVTFGAASYLYYHHKRIFTHKHIEEFIRPKFITLDLREHK